MHGWRSLGDAIHKEFAFRGFRGAIAFVNRVAELANAAGAPSGHGDPLQPRRRLALHPRRRRRDGEGRGAGPETIDGVAEPEGDVDEWREPVRTVELRVLDGPEPLFPSTRRQAHAGCRRAGSAPARRRSPRSRARPGSERSIPARAESDQRLRATARVAVQLTRRIAAGRRHRAARRPRAHRSRVRAGDRRVPVAPARRRRGARRRRRERDGGRAPPITRSG